MKVLFVDDMDERHRAFEAPLAGKVDIVFAHTAAGAIDALNREAFDQVFLDHDMSEEDIMIEVGGRSVEPTGMAVVEHLLSMADPPKNIVVHSMNEPAAREMERRLVESGRFEDVARIPFHHLLVSLEAR